MFSSAKARKGMSRVPELVCYRFLCCLLSKSMVIVVEGSSYCTSSAEVLHQHDIRVLPVRLRA